MKPSQGRIVIYVDEKGEHSPAVVTAAHSATCVNLRVFLDVYRDVPLVTSVLEDPSMKSTKSWHWPPRVPDGNGGTVEA